MHEAVRQQQLAANQNISVALVAKMARRTIHALPYALYYPAYAVEFTLAAHANCQALLEVSRAPSW